MRKLLVTTFTVIAASGCAGSSTVPDPIDDEPPPSSGQPAMRAAATSPTSAKPSDPRLTGPQSMRDAQPDAAPDFPGGPDEDFVVGGWTPTGFVDPDAN